MKLMESYDKFQVQAVEGQDEAHQVFVIAVKLLKMEFFDNQLSFYMLFKVYRKTISIRN